MNPAKVTMNIDVKEQMLTTKQITHQCLFLFINGECSLLSWVCMIKKLFPTVITLFFRNCSSLCVLPFGNISSLAYRLFSKTSNTIISLIQSVFFIVYSTFRVLFIPPIKVLQLQMKVYGNNR